jgi:tetratricopeptide (TPR) repeat protein
VLVALLLAAPASAQSEAPASGGSAVALFERGTHLYEEADFDGAADAFSQIVAMGVEQPTVHYNLANAWFKTGRLGPAIFHYRKAHQLAPRDADIIANLEYARFLALDRIEEDAATDRPVEGWLDRITPAEAARIPAALFVLAGIAGCGAQLFRGRSRLWGRSFVVLLGLWALSFAGAWAVEHRASRSSEAVVLAREAIVRNGPGESFDTAFVLHEGAEVVVEGDRGSWTEVSLPGDLRGWIATDGIARF